MNVILTTYQGAILGPIARVLGYILQALYALLANFGIENTGICMILFTFLVNGLMMPMQIKQQKFSKMSMIMNPEIQAIQKKYKDKKFAAGCSRDVINTGAERLGWPIEELMEKTILAMRSCEDSVNAAMEAL